MVKRRLLCVDLGQVSLGVLLMWSLKIVMFLL